MEKIVFTLGRMQTGATLFAALPSSMAVVFIDIITSDGLVSAFRDYAINWLMYFAITTILLFNIKRPRHLYLSLLLLAAEGAGVISGIAFISAMDAYFYAHFSTNVPPGIAVQQTINDIEVLFKHLGDGSHEVFFDSYYASLATGKHPVVLLMLILSLFLYLLRGLVIYRMVRK